MACSCAGLQSCRFARVQVCVLRHSNAIPLPLPYSRHHQLTPYAKLFDLGPILGGHRTRTRSLRQPGLFRRRTDSAHRTVLSSSCSLRSSSTTTTPTPTTAHDSRADISHPAAATRSPTPRAPPHNPAGGSARRPWSAPTTRAGGSRPAADHMHIVLCLSSCGLRLDSDCTPRCVPTHTVAPHLLPAVFVFIRSIVCTVSPVVFQPISGACRG